MDRESIHSDTLSAHSDLHSQSYSFTRRRTSSDPRRRTHTTLTIISGEINSQVDTKLKVGSLGRGINCLDGSIKTHLFDDLKVVYIEEYNKSEKLNHFKTHDEYMKEATMRMGIPNAETAVFSLLGDQKDVFPFMCNIDRLDSYQHYLYETEETLYTLKAKLGSSHASTFFTDSDVQYIKENEFNNDTKQVYYAIIDRYGTHFVKSCSFGAKAELRWSFAEKAENGMERMQNLQHMKKRFNDTLENWKSAHYRSDSLKAEDERLPRGCLEERKVTYNFTLGDSEKLRQAEQIKLHLEEISALFTENARDNMELAVKCYLDEMKPKKSVDEIKEEGLIAIYCLDNQRYVRVDTHGHLFADSTKITIENEFRIKKKGSRVAMKSLKYKDKFLSKALITSIFHFHRLQFMGPHESFEIYEDHLKVCGNLTGSSFIYVAPEDQQMHHNGDLRHKSRFAILDAEVRCAYTEDGIEEPFFADDFIEEEVEVKVEPIIKPTQPTHAKTAPSRPKDSANLSKQLFKKDTRALKDIGKSNSTSSIFIKDTILLPNIDELTRCLAVEIHKILMEAKGDPAPGKYLEIFSEEKHPLTRSTNFHAMPSEESINHLVNTVFKVGRLSPEAGIMCMIYIKRLLKKSSLKMVPENWRRVTMSCLMLASKVWEDQAVWNVDFIDLFPNLSVKDLNRLETQLLNSLEFSVSIPASEYVKTYFELREYSNMRVERDSSSKPLEESDLKKLEVRTAASEKEYEKEMLRFHKSYSMDTQPADQKHHTPGSGGLGIVS